MPKLRGPSLVIPISFSPHCHWRSDEHCDKRAAVDESTFSFAIVIVFFCYPLVCLTKQDLWYACFVEKDGLAWSVFVLQPAAACITRRRGIQSTFVTLQQTHHVKLVSCRPPNRSDVYWQWLCETTCSFRNRLGATKLSQHQSKLKKYLRKNVASTDPIQLTQISTQSLFIFMTED